MEIQQGKIWLEPFGKEAYENYFKKFIKDKNTYRIYGDTNFILYSLNEVNYIVQRLSKASHNGNDYIVTHLNEDSTTDIIFRNNGNNQYWLKDVKYCYLEDDENGKKLLDDKELLNYKFGIHLLNGDYLTQQYKTTRIAPPIYYNDYLKYRFAYLSQTASIDTAIDFLVDNTKGYKQSVIDYYIQLHEAERKIERDKSLAEIKVDSLSIISDELHKWIAEEHITDIGDILIVNFKDSEMYFAELKFGIIGKDKYNWHYAFSCKVSKKNKYLCRKGDSNEMYYSNAGLKTLYNAKDVIEWLKKEYRLYKKIQLLQDEMESK